MLMQISINTTSNMKYPATFSNTDVCRVQGLGHATDRGADHPLTILQLVIKYIHHKGAAKSHHRPPHGLQD